MIPSRQEETRRAISLNAERKESLRKMLLDRPFASVYATRNPGTNKFGMRDTEINIEIKEKGELQEGKEGKGEVQAEDVEKLLSDIAQKVAEEEELEDDDMMYISVRSEDPPVERRIEFTPIKKLDFSTLSDQLYRLLGYSKELRFHEGLTMKFLTKKFPKGGGGKGIVIAAVQDLVRKHSLKSLKYIQEPLCLPATIANLLDREEKYRRGIEVKDTKSRWQDIQDRCIHLCNCANVSTEQMCGVKEIKKFENFLKRRIVQYVFERGFGVKLDYPGNPTYYNKNNSDVMPLPMYIFLDREGKHYYGIPKIESLFSGQESKSKYCHLCQNPHNREHHDCFDSCVMCGNSKCTAMRSSLRCVEITCDKCNRVFSSNSCFENHKKPRGTVKHSKCDYEKNCKKCNRRLVGAISQKDHVCFETQCRNCKGRFKTVEMNKHKCYIQTKKLKKISDKYIFFDIESTQDYGLKKSVHEPNLIMAMDFEGEMTFFGVFSEMRVKEEFDWENERRAEALVDYEKYLDKLKEEKIEDTRKVDMDNFKELKYTYKECKDSKDLIACFCKWLFTDHVGYTVVAHNAKGYDLQFIYGWMLNNINEDTVKTLFEAELEEKKNATPEEKKEPSSDAKRQKAGRDRKNINKRQNLNVTFAGSNIMYMEVILKKMRFIDSYLFTQCGLDKFPKTFGLVEMKKGYFPHFFNKSTNYDYGWKPKVWEKKHTSGCTGECDKDCTGLSWRYPAARLYGCNSLGEEKRMKLLDWHKERLDRGDKFNFLRELLLYCLSDVQILRKGCQIFRKTMVDEFGMDPFQYMTLPQSAFALYRAKFMDKDKMAVIDERHGEKQSKQAMDWLEYVSRKEKREIKHGWNGGEKTINTSGFRYKVDGYCEETRTVYEYNGCYWHGCMKCNNRDTVNDKKGGKIMEELYKETMEREENIRKEGYNIVVMWEHDWVNISKDLLKKKDKVMMEINDSDVRFRGPPNIRSALHGGRTNVISLLHFFKGSEIGKYIDINSLYPAVQYFDMYPVGHPELINYGDKRLNEENIKSGELFGLIKCKVAPPRGLLHPVLPLYMKEKLHYTLCRTCAENCSKEKCTCSEKERALYHNWTTVELCVALSKGYKIVEFFSAYNWPVSQRSNELFYKYVSVFSKLKSEASGWPRKDMTLEEKEAYIREYYEGTLVKRSSGEEIGITLDADKICDNPGMKAIAKLYLNSLWGKISQRGEYSSTMIFRDQTSFDKFLFDKKIKNKHIEFMNEDVVEVSFCKREEFNPVNYNISPIVGVFTTSWARMRLYKAIDKLGPQVLGFDTDSVFYYYDPKNPKHEDIPDSDVLGCFKDELKKKNMIDYWIAGGPKNYWYRLNTGEETMKLKGFSLNYRTSTQINPVSLLKVIVKDKGNERGGVIVKKNKGEKRATAVTVTNPTQILKSRKGKDVVTAATEKEFGWCYTKNRVLGDREKAVDFTSKELPAFNEDDIGPREMLKDSDYFTYKEDINTEPFGF